METIQVGESFQKQNSFLSDLADTLNNGLKGVEGSLIEIAEAEEGGSAFNRATYHSALTASSLEKIIERRKNLAFLTGVLLDPAPETGKISTRLSGDDAIHQKNIISVDCDFKDLIPGFLELSADQKKAIVASTFHKFHPAIKAKLGDLWAAVFTGNGLHLHFRLSSPLKVDDKENYSEGYRYFLEHLEATVFAGELKLDRSCQNAARLMRLPLSSNLKSKPIQTDIIYHNPKSDSGCVINAVWEQASAARASNEQAQKIQQTHFQGNSSHKENLKQALSFNSILQHYGYQKFYSIQEQRNGEYLCSSPWKADNTPSCFLNESKKVFHDFSSGKHGDVFQMIAAFEGWDSRSHFPKIVEKAELITGIQNPERLNNLKKPHLVAVNSDNQFGQKKGGKPVAEDYFKFFEGHMPNNKVDLLSGQLMTLHRGHWQPASSRLDVLSSYAIETEYLKKAHLSDFMARYADTKEPELLIDIPNWDGVDRIEQISKCVHLKNTTQINFAELMKAWGANLFSRVKNPSHQNQIVILKGGQGIGKDTLLDSLTGAFDSLATDMTISSNQADNLAMLSDHVLLRISEFDRTSKTDVATFKDWITKKEVTFRRPYAKSHQKYSVRCSFIATINVDEILRDHTGNRRFIIFDIEKIDWDYPKDESIQVIAQFKHLSDQGFKASQEARESMNAYIEEQTPEDPKEAILETFDHKIRELESQQIHKNGRFNRAEIEGVLLGIQHLYGFKAQKVLELLRLNNRSIKSGGYKYYYRKKQPSET